MITSISLKDDSIEDETDKSPYEAGLIKKKEITIKTSLEKEISESEMKIKELESKVKESSKNQVVAMIESQRDRRDKIIDRLSKKA